MPPIKTNDNGPNPQQNGWHEWSRHVLAELERLNVNCERMQKGMESLRLDVAMLKVKSGLWGVTWRCRSCPRAGEPRSSGMQACS